jgi:hypothetical protein
LSDSGQRRGGRAPRHLTRGRGARESRACRRLHESADVLKWFDQLGAVKLEAVLSRFGLTPRAPNGSPMPLLRLLLRSTGPRDSETMDALAMLTEDRKDTKHPIELQRLEGYKGIFASAHEQLREGRLDSFIDTVRAQAEDDLLEQAEALRDDGLLVAATVLAGGALEVHLRQLCAKTRSRFRVTAPSTSTTPPRCGPETAG